MYLGKIVEMGPVKTILQKPSHPYTKALIASIPSHVPGANRQPADIKGALPDAIKPQSGCLFNDRCPIGIDRCRSEAPELRNIAGRQVSCHLINEREED